MFILTPGIRNLTGMKPAARGNRGGGVGGLPYQVVGTRGEISALEGAATTASNVKQIGRNRHYIGDVDVTEIKLGFAGWFVDATGELNASNAVTLKAAVECNGVTVPVLFEGSNSKVINPGDALVLTDALTPSQFGLTRFTKYTQYWIRYERECVEGGKFIYHTTSAYDNPISGEGCVVGATSAVSQLLNTGALTTGSGWVAQNSWMFFPVVTIGKPVSKMFALGVVGASIENGVGDNGGDGLNDGGGWLRRSMHDVYGRKLARVSLAKSGETSKIFVQSYAKRSAIFPYVNHAWAGHGGNDYSTGETASNTLTRFRTTWQILKSAGIGHVEQILLSPKTDSTDTWDTVANQTPKTGFETGGAWRDFVNNTVISEVASDANIDGYYDHTAAQVDATLTDRWVAFGTIDGVHPSEIVHEAMADLVKSRLEEMRRTYVGEVLAAPANTVAPTVTGGAVVGQVLTVTSNGTWTGSNPISYAYQWKSNGVAISGATNSTYTLTANETGDSVTVSVTATNAAGSTEATSNAIGPIEASAAYSGEAVALFAAMTVQPSDTRKTAIDNMIVALKNANVWNKMDAIQVYMAHDQQASLLNWKNPATFTGTLNGTPTFTADAGVATNTSSSWINTGYNPATGGSQYVQDSASFIVDVLVGVTNASSLAGFHDGSKGTTIAPSTGTFVSMRINQASAVTINNTQPTGFFVLNRTGATAAEAFRNGTSLGTTAQVSAAVANGNFRIGSISGTTSLARTFGLFAAGAGLTSTEQAAFYTAWNTFKSSL
ncbi:putative YapH protein [Sinorhizobium phage phiN3]|uniref:Putative YapH protein n=1 Tax=Sinorhizobium phage phiN3 TaxID=1647405 RepID=A0A0F6YR57_9CAUD|nr:putative YapH protein [Sinorhizobium phage phiN3]AKF13575.1 putative YapH protein [Sinorhizobium phage phiN3]